VLPPSFLSLSPWPGLRVFVWFYRVSHAIRPRDAPSSLSSRNLLNPERPRETDPRHCNHPDSSRRHFRRHDEPSPTSVSRWTVHVSPDSLHPQIRSSAPATPRQAIRRIAIGRHWCRAAEDSKESGVSPGRKHQLHIHGYRYPNGPSTEHWLAQDCDLDQQERTQYPAGQIASTSRSAPRQYLGSGVFVRHQGHGIPRSRQVHRQAFEREF
jgi:hypothetical protein